MNVYFYKHGNFLTADLSFTDSIESENRFKMVPNGRDYRFVNLDDYFISLGRKSGNDYSLKLENSNRNKLILHRDVYF